MPVHDHRCLRCGEIEEIVISREDLDKPQTHICGGMMERVFLTFPHSWVQPDICYDSPIDGRPITSMQARLEDLARSNSVPYDPEMKKDTDRKIKEDEARLERSVDDFVEKEILTMPVRKREKLEAELTSGIDVNIVRQTTGATNG
jgi:hypothetical protein